MMVETGNTDIKVEIGNESAFLDLPERLYPARDCPRNRAAEAQLLSGTHILSKYFETVAFTASRNGHALSRCALTFYPDDDTAYLGFFDSADDEGAAQALFAKAESFALSRGKRRIAGPLDASFWLGYRMKTNMFDATPYFGEPCGLPWYQKLWEQNGYAVTDAYSSNLYGVASAYTNEKYTERLAAFKEKGYIIRSPKRTEWDKLMGEVYGLIMRLYSDFPMFKPISEDDFRNHYAGLKYLVDFSMVKMAYLNGKAVGFLISVPDYGHRLNRKAGLLTFAWAYWKKLRPSRYVMLYLGVDPAHAGLGKAIAQTIVDTLLKKQVASIGALIHQGKVNERYVEDMVEDKYQYVLFEKHIAQNQ